MRYALLLASSLGFSAAAAYDPAEVIGRAILKAIDRTRTIPNYTCVETVRRDYFEPAAAALSRDCAVLLKQRLHPAPDTVLHLYSTDRLRLDVTLSSRGEIFSWSGASRFEDRDVGQLVHNGPMGTGSFGGFLAIVFNTDVRNFAFERTLAEGPGLLMEYSFQVAQPDSHYKVKLNNSWVYVPYSGTVRVEPETADVVSMTVVTGESPPDTGICQLTTTLDFAKVPIGDVEFLLPKQTRQRFVYPNVEETENTTVFTACREFRGESTVTFSPGETAKSGGAVRASANPHSVPRGLAFSFALTAAIPTDTAAAGDAFSAKLTDALRDNRGKVLAPKGSAVEGRLLRVQSFSKPPEVLVVLHPETIWSGDTRLAVNAVRDWSNLVARKPMGRGVEILIPLRGEDNSGVFRFSGQHTLIPPGFRSDWKSVN